MPFTTSRPHRARRLASLAPSLLTALLLASPATSQEPPTTPATVFVEEIGVEVINVDVVVTDKKGRPVRGLDRDDFELKIDGQPVEIANFLAVDGAAEAAAARGPGGAAAPAAAAEEAGEPVHLVLYFDNFYLEPAGRRQLLQELPAFLESQVAAGADVMLVAHDGSTRFLSSFTSDLDTVRTALAELGSMPASGVRNRTARRSVLKNVQDIFQVCEETRWIADPCHKCLDSMQEAVGFYSIAAETEKRGALLALDQVVNALSVLDGRKVLLYVSDGLEEQAGLDLYYYLSDLCPNFQDFPLRVETATELSDLVAHANRSRVTFYTLDAAGARSFSTTSAESEDRRFTPSTRVDQIRFANLQSPLFYVAHETGGQAIFNANRFTPDLERIDADFRQYYSLGYAPQHAGTGHSHRVTVKLTGKNLEVRYRRSFLHKAQEQQLADRTLGALMFGARENPLAAALAAGTPTEAADGRVRVPLEVAIPIERLALVPSDAGRQGRLTLVIAAPDDGGKLTAIRKQEVVVTLPAGEEGADVYRVGVHVDLEPGEHQLGIGIWDEIAAVGSFLSLHVETGEPAKLVAASGPGT